MGAQRHASKECVFQYEMGPRAKAARGQERRAAQGMGAGMQPDATITKACPGLHRLLPGTKYSGSLDPSPDKCIAFRPEGGLSMVSDFD